MAATVDLNNSNQVLVNENEGRNMVNDNDKSLIKAAVVNKATKFDDATFAASVHVEKALLHDLYVKTPYLYPCKSITFLITSF